MDNVITIELFGQQYSFKADAGVHDADEVAEMVRKEVATLETQLSGKTATMSKTAILALAALNISSEYIALKNQHAELLQYISQKSESLISKTNVNYLES